MSPGGNSSAAQFSERLSDLTNALLPPAGYHRAEHYEPLDRIEDEWKHIENVSFTFDQKIFSGVPPSLSDEQKVFIGLHIQSLCCACLSIFSRRNKQHF